MSDLKLRTEEDRLAGTDEAYTSGDPFHPRTEAERVAEAAKGERKPSVDFPRWIEPHKSRIVVEQPSGIIHVPMFETFVRRHDKQVTVLVHDAAQEKFVQSETEAAKLAREAEEAAKAPPKNEPNPT